MDYEKNNYQRGKKKCKNTHIHSSLKTGMILPALKKISPRYKIAGIWWDHVRWKGHNHYMLYESYVEHCTAYLLVSIQSYAPLTESPLDQQWLFVRSPWVAERWAFVRTARGPVHDDGGVLSSGGGVHTHRPGGGRGGLVGGAWWDSICLVIQGNKHTVW